MTGHQALIAMRRDRKVPTCVWIVDGIDLSCRDWHQQPNSFDGTLHASVQIDATDVPGTLDLRFVVGLKVHLVPARGDDRARRLFDAIVAAKPRSLFSCINNEVVIYG